MIAQKSRPASPVAPATSAALSIGPYEVLGSIGRGGMGIVFKARSPEGRVVAVKQLIAEAAPSGAARFERERRLLGSLTDQEGFVPLLDAGVAPGGPFLVMPFLPGGTLRRKLASGPLGVDETLRVGRRLADALAAAHARGIVHRDLKPENVLFTETGEPRIADLGLAKHLACEGRHAASLSRTGEGMGTPGYMASEQFDDAKSAGPPADVFALGAILYECLVGRCPPYIGRQSVVQLRPEIPLWVSLAVEKALARDPKDRFADGNAFALALAQAQTKMDFAVFQQAKTVELGAAPLADTETRERFVDEVPASLPETIKVDPPAPAVSEPVFASQAPASLAETKAPPAPGSKTETKPDLPSTVTLPPEPRPKDWTWLWVVILVVVGVAVGVLADRFLR
jgi:serine/threonine protein kinase